MNCLIYFWYKGAFHKKRQYEYVYCFVHDIDLNASEDWNKQQAEETLASMITGGLIDHRCDAGIDDFGVLRINLNTSYDVGIQKSISLLGEKMCYLPKK